MKRGRAVKVSAEQKQKRKILWLSDSTTTATGFASVTRKVLNGLSEDYEVHAIGHNFFGQTCKPGIEFLDGERIEFYVHGAGKARYSMDVLSNTIKKFKIDYAGGLLDTFMLYESGFLNVDLSPAKTFFYYPSDGGGGLPLKCEDILKKVQHPLAMSKFGQTQVKKRYNIDSTYIPHGVDCDLFRPLPEEERRRLKFKVWRDPDKFVVGTVARNQGRKMLDRTIKTFALFCKDKPNAVLFLHTDPYDQAAPFDLNELIKLYHLENRVVYTGTSFHNPFTYKEMNDVYNTFDIFILTTSGEGFGIPIIEAMACGIPQIVTDYTTGRELVLDDGQSGFVANLLGESFESNPWVHCDEILEGTITGTWNVERGMMSLRDCSDKMNLLYNDKKLRDKFSKTGVEKAKRLYDWHVVMRMWKDFFKKLDGDL